MKPLMGITTLVENPLRDLKNQFKAHGLRPVRPSYYFGVILVLFFHKKIPTDPMGLSSHHGSIFGSSLFVKINLHRRYTNRNRLANGKLHLVFYYSTKSNLAISYSIICLSNIVQAIGFCNYLDFAFRNII